MTTTPTKTANPKRVRAGKANRAKRKGLSAAGRERLRQAALMSKPWRFATGPRSPEGRARVALNGKLRQRGPRSMREIRADLADLRGLIEIMAQARQVIGEMPASEQVFA
jgi:hypothetical protein